MVLRLRDDVFCNIINGQTVLLDLRCNRYFALQTETDQAFQKFLSGALLEPIDTSRLAPLFSAHILEEGVARLCPVNAADAEKPTHSLLEDLTTAQGDADLLSALLPQLKVGFELKTRRLDVIMARLRNRKHSGISNQGRQDDAKLAIILAPFLKTRRYVSPENKCLRWSIAMVDYLSKFNLTPDLYIGVRMAPFAAHAWVQQGPAVLSDTIERTLLFTPILKI